MGPDYRKKCIEGRHKPGSVTARGMLEGTCRAVAAIHLDRLLPDGSSSQPGSLGAKLPCLRKGARPLFGLAPGGVCHAGLVTKPPVRSCRTLSPLPVRFRRHRRYTLCGTFPELRSIGPRRPAGVTRHPCFVEPGLSSRGSLHPQPPQPPDAWARLYQGGDLGKLSAHAPDRGPARAGT